MDGGGRAKQEARADDPMDGGGRTESGTEVETNAGAIAEDAMERPSAYDLQGWRKCIRIAGAIHARDPFGA